MLPISNTLKYHLKIANSFETFRKYGDTYMLILYLLYTLYYRHKNMISIVDIGTWSDQRRHAIRQG